MKKISIIVPVYNVENYLERCLNSLVNQTLNDIEIIIINDGSPDNSQDIIDDFAKKYPEKIVSLTIPNGGVSNARNIGLDKATGEYVGFVDSDDFVDITMYEQLYDKAKKDNADIVVSGYSKLYVRTTIDFNLGHTELFGKPFVESPEMIIKGVPYIWNKIFKRSMLEEHHVRFEHFKIFEDLLFTYKNYLYANKISKVDRALYYYRNIRDGSVTNTFNEKFFDIFKVIDSLYNCANQIHSNDIVYDYILYTALNHIIIRWETPVLPEELPLKESFYYKSIEYLENRFPDYKEHTLYFEHYEDKSPTDYYNKKYWKKRFKEDIKDSQETVNIKKKKKAKSDANIIQHAKIRLQKDASSFLPMTFNNGSNYNQFLSLPINETAILLDPQHGADCNGNMFYLLKAMYFDSRYKNFNFYLNVDKKRTKEFHTKLNFYNMTNVKLVKFESRKYLQLLATAKYIFTDTSLPVYFIKRSEQIYFNTWHGTPLKTLGRSSHDEMHRIGNLQKNFRIADYVLYPSEYMKEHMLSDYMLENVSTNKIMLAGYPRNSIFFTKPNKKIIKEEHLQDKQVIAYLPTWRGSLDDAAGTDEIITHLNYIDTHLKDNQVFYVNLHPYLKGTINLNQFKNIKTIPSKYETYDFLNCCDVLITDYSSVFFDFANTKKKILLFAYDKEEYFRDRGVYFDFDELPFTTVYDTPALMDAIITEKDYDESQFLEKFCPYDNENAAKKECEFLILGHNNIVKTQPVPHNGKKNVMIFIGAMINNLVTEQWINCLEHLNFDKYNYFLTFKSGQVYRNKLLLRTLPENVNYISQLGPMSLSLNDKLSLEEFNKFPNSYTKDKQHLDLLFETEKNRAFGSIAIDKIIYYGAKDKNEMAVLSKFNCEKSIYMLQSRINQRTFNCKLINSYDTVYVKNDTLKNKLFEWTKHPNIIVFDNPLEIFN